MLTVRLLPGLYSHYLTLPLVQRSHRLCWLLELKHPPFILNTDIEICMLFSAMLVKKDDCSCRWLRSKMLRSKSVFLKAEVHSEYRQLCWKK